MPGITDKKPFHSLPNESPVRTQERLSIAINQLVSHPVIHGVFLDNIPVESGFNYIEHGLGEPVRYWIVVDSNYPQSYYRGTNDANHPEDRFLLIKCTHGATISLYVIVANPSGARFQVESHAIQA